MSMGKYGPRAQNFGYDFWVQFRASQETIFSLKILTKIRCCRAHIYHLETFDPAKKRQKNNFQRQAAHSRGEIESANAKFGKTQFF